MKTGYQKWRWMTENWEGEDVQPKAILLPNLSKREGVIEKMRFNLTERTGYISVRSLNIESIYYVTHYHTHKHWNDPPW